MSECNYEIAFEFTVWVAKALGQLDSNLSHVLVDEVRRPC